MPVQVRFKERICFEQRDWGQWPDMAAPLLFQAVEGIWSVLTVMDKMYGQQKINKNETQSKKFEFIFVINEK